MAIDVSSVRDFPLFHAMEATALAALLARAGLRRAEAGDAFFRQGEAADAFHLLLDGRLKVTQMTADGRQILMRVVNPGDLFGFARVLALTHYPGTARAAVPSMAISWPMSEWDAAVESNPRLAVNAMQTIGRRLGEAHTRLREMHTLEVERRVACAVLRLIEQAGASAEGGGTRIDFPITRQDIAEMTGTTLHTVSRLLSAWEAQGFVRGGRQKLTVIDAESLARIAGPNTEF